MSNFILMLTRDDVTVPNAEDVLALALETPVQHVGFKDVGLSVPEMGKLVRTIQDAGRQAHLEVVSLSEDDERRSIEIGLELGFDYILGGTHRDVGRRLINGTTVKYLPYVGPVVGHPGILTGSLSDITDDLAQAQDDGQVAGVNVLAYRHASLRGDLVAKHVCEAASVPVLIAGSINSLARVRAVAEIGAWGFTIGAAALDHTIVPGGDLRAQLVAVLDAGQQEVGAR